MKKTIKSLSLVIFAVLFILTAISCGEKKSDTDLLKDAVYTENTELGEGSKTLKVEVKVGDSTIVFTVHTDADTVGAALVEHGLLEGDEGEYGLYVKKVNGMKADYDEDGTYWAFYVNGEYALSGVDSTEIDESKVYRLERTKG